MDRTDAALQRAEAMLYDSELARLHNHHGCQMQVGVAGFAGFAKFPQRGQAFEFAVGLAQIKHPKSGGA